MSLLSAALLLCAIAYTEGTAQQYTFGSQASEAPSDVPSDVPSHVPSPSPSALIAASGVSSLPTYLPNEVDPVLQSCPAGSVTLVDGVPYAVSPIGPTESETFCFAPTSTAKVFCYTSCDDDAICNAAVNPIMPSDATIRLKSYGEGAKDNNKCTSANFYVNEEYCAVMVDHAQRDEGVALTVTNTLTNNKVIDWAGKMEAVSVTCTTKLPTCRGPNLKTGVTTNIPTLPAFKLDPNQPIHLPPVYGDFCLDDIKHGDSVECGVQCANSACQGDWTIFLEKNFPATTYLCMSMNEPCHLFVDQFTKRLIVRVRATTNTGPLVDYAITCTVNGQKPAVNETSGA